MFSKRWKEIGLGEDELRALQIMLLKDPVSGPIMEGTGGIRKVRFPLQNRGKSGSVRVCYTDFAEYEVIYLITAFKKKSQENLTEEEKNSYKALTVVDDHGDFKMSDATMEKALLILTVLLEKHYGKKAVLLIDEYDVPLDKAFQYGYYDELSLIHISEPTRP